jgi:glyoxylase-like metal-dependent hydrolase (beta-lactamase superfamily II)
LGIENRSIDQGRILNPAPAMNGLEFAVCQLLRIPGFTAMTVLTLALLSNGKALAALAVRRVEIAPSIGTSHVPQATAQGHSLAPQAVSAVDVSADGRFITVGTMAFSHDANVWQFAPDGTVIAKRHFPPWAPMQVATLNGGRAMAIGLAYSRVTSPDPTVWFGPATNLFNDPLTEELKDALVEADSPDGQMARLRPGAGDWRTGWFASHLGELFARGPDWVFKPPGWLLDADGHRQALRFADRNQLPTSRAMRMAASADGKRLVFGWIGLAQGWKDLPARSEAVSVWQVSPNQKLWSARATAGPPPSLPDPATDFPDMAKDFRLAADALLPGHVVAAVAINRDGSRVAVVEYGVQAWVRSQPAIGRWNPPIRVLNFVPGQRGRLRVFDGGGKELFHESLPVEGMFEVAFGGDDEVWCWPGSWFARGMAGAPWLPVDRPANALYRVETKLEQATAFAFPDAIADCALSSAGDRISVSCWDGRVYLLERTGKTLAKLEVGSPARLAWSGDGLFAVAGTAEGRVLRVERNGKLDWTRTVPVAEVPPLTQPPGEIVTGLPIYQGGRIHRGEHAYVGDIWVIRSGDNGIMVDCGGTSGTSFTQARLRALGIKQVTHVLHTHTHGDHAGGAYLWRALGAQMVGPESAALTLTWLMPMLTDYGIYPPRPLDLPLPLKRVGDETEFEVSGLRFRALFVPGHSFDLTIYKTELGRQRIAFTGDLGFENQDILHRCWGDANKARAVVRVIRDKLLAWRPDLVFTGHGLRPNGTEFIEGLVQQTDKSLALVRASTETDKAVKTNSTP